MVTNLTGSELDSIVLKIQKLLALSQSSNEHEAALAAARAQDLLFRYNLDMASVADATNPRTAYARNFFTIGSGKALEWKRDLVFVLARFNFCRAFTYSGSKTMAIVGQRHNYEVVTGLYDYLSAAFGRLVERAFTEYRLAGGAEHHLTYKTSWLLGAVAGVRAQLLAQQQANKAASEASSALVLVKDAELDAAVNDLIGGVVPRKGASAKSVSGYGAGYQTGRTIGLHKQVQATGSAHALAAK